jgi:hypothetical protein
LVRSGSAMRCHRVTRPRRAGAGIEPGDGEPNPSDPKGSSSWTSSCGQLRGQSRAARNPEVRGAWGFWTQIDGSWAIPFHCRRSTTL